MTQQLLTNALEVAKSLVYPHHATRVQTARPGFAVAMYKRCRRGHFRHAGRWAGPSSLYEPPAGVLLSTPPVVKACSSIGGFVCQRAILHMTGEHSPLKTATMNSTKLVYTLISRYACERPFEVFCIAARPSVGDQCTFTVHHCTSSRRQNRSSILQTPHQLGFRSQTSCTI